MTIFAAVTRVLSEENLETGSVSIRLGVELPSGDVVYADATPEVLQRMLRISVVEQKSTHHSDGKPSIFESSQLSPLVEETPSLVELQDAPVEAEDLDKDVRVDWKKLPDDLLPERVKAAMSALQVGGESLPATLLVSQVIQLRDSILAEYTDDDWAQLGVGQGSSAHIQWQSSYIAPPKQGSQQAVHVDDAGNPIVPFRSDDVDPGEISAVDDDDDDTEQF